MTRFDSVKEADRALFEEYGISRSLVDDLFTAVEMASGELIHHYDLGVEVDEDIVAQQLKIAFAEGIADYSEEFTDLEDRVEFILTDLRKRPVANCKTAAGRVASRTEDMMQVSEAILHDRE